MREFGGNGSNLPRAAVYVKTIILPAFIPVSVQNLCKFFATSVNTYLNLKWLRTLRKHVLLLTRYSERLSHYPEREFQTSNERIVWPHQCYFL